MTASDARPRAGREQDFRVAMWVASLPVIFGVLMVAVMVVAGLLNVPLHAVLADWGLIGVFGQVVFLPLWLLSWLGAAALGRRFAMGRVIMSAVSLATVLWFSSVVYGQVHESLSPEPGDPTSWWIDLGVGEGVVFIVPFVAIVVANLWLLARLWRRRA